ncbi:MAG: hypothetical protein IPK32_15385 [Verrucomicrobiaceae bacterium]|nr:hypothetical protein [Verrucomicrobiaceae bacterium]
MAKTRKPTTELLLPSSSVWQSWIGNDGDTGMHSADFTAQSARFSRDSQRRVLALPATHFWALPAWLKGSSEHLRSMAQLHLERMSVKCGEGEDSVQVRSISEKDDAHLTRILALKDLPTPLDDLARLPDEVTLHALCYPLVANSLTIFRELDRLVVAITSGSDLIYCTPLSANRLDEHALSELNNICLQLGFQRVLGRLEGIVLWVEDGDTAQIQRVTGLPAWRSELPPPTLPEKGSTLLMPVDLNLERARQATRSKTRLIAFTVGAALAACIAIIATLTALALQERNKLRNEVAALMPRASRVAEHRRTWNEAAPAVDPTCWPQQMLLHCLESEASKESTITHWEWTPELMSITGRMPSASLALHYQQELTANENLAHFTWTSKTGDIAADNSTIFEMKGELGE